MKLIIYAGGEYTTGDEIAAALLEYSKGLAEEDRAETIEIPILNEDGSTGTAMFLVGPASQIAAKDIETGFEELRAPEAVARLRRLTGELHAVVRPETTRDANTAGWVADDEF